MLALTRQMKPIKLIPVSESSTHPLQN